MGVKVYDLFKAACRRHRDVAFQEISEADRVLIAIYMLEAEINNGGFDQYYFNSSGDTDYYAPVALRLIGARATADIVEKANSLFGSGGPPVSRAERQKALFAIRNQKEMWDSLDQQFYEYPDDISGLLQRFLASGLRNLQ